MAIAETLAGIPVSASDIAPTMSDRLLWARFVEHGDESAFAGLMHRHGRTVWGVCRRLLHQEQDVEDAFQAVFLVLARKIASIRKGEAVGSWLYGVAYRTAMKVRRSAARRRVHEQRAPVSTAQPPSPPSEAACRELQRMLDEEVERLAAKFREPFVLCCLEGMSRSEAAAELGWKEGTVCGRLAQARKLLQSRLARRGITLSSSLTAGALAESTAAAPAAILGPAGIKAVLASAAPGKAATTALAPSVLALADSIGRSLTAVKLKLALWLGLALTLAAGVCLAAIPDKSDPVAPPPKKGPMVEAAQPEDPRPKAPPRQPVPGGRWVGGLVFSPDAKRLANSISRVDQPGHLRIWEAAVHNELINLTDIPVSSAAAFSPDGKTVAVAELTGDIRMREAATGEETAVIKGPGSEVNSLAYSPDATQLLAGDVRGTLTLWNLKAPQTPRVFRGHLGNVLAVAFLHRRRAIVSGSTDGTARIWDIDTGTEKLVLSGHLGEIFALAVAPDDSLLATLGRDRTVRLWNMDSGKETITITGKNHLSVAFSPDCKRLALAAQDGSIRLWDVGSKSVVKELDRQVRAMHALAFTADGKLLSAGSRQLPGIVQLDIEDDAGKSAAFQEYYSSLRAGAETLRVMEFRGRDADQFVRFEPEGLRITLPSGQPATDQGTGASPRLVVRGDFDITVKFEILHEPEPEETEKQTRFSLAVVLNRNPDWKNMASVTRRTAPGGRNFALWSILQFGGEPVEERRRNLTVPAKLRTGRLRLKRSGTLLSYYVADGRDGPFMLFRQIPFVDEDLKEVRLVASTGGPKASLDVRMTDLRIRAESLPDLADRSVIEAVTSEPKRWLPAAIVGIVGLAGCLGTGLLVLLRRRRSQQAVWVIPIAEPAAPPIAAEPTLLCICTGCGKKLRGGPALAGKMIKCPKCGDVVRLPGK